jgi:mRNA-degrading endonuclease RelE of RelBE toxin-antitoxin system
MTRFVIIPVDKIRDAAMLSGMVTVTLVSEAREQLGELPRLIVLRMEKLLARLGQWPNVSGVKRLRGDLAGKCRLRTGDYRLQFRVEEKKRTIEERKTVRGKEVATQREVTDFAVLVEKIGHRDGFYEE